MSTQNVCFHGEIRKISIFLTKKKHHQELCPILYKNICCEYLLEIPWQGTSINTHNIF